MSETTALTIAQAVEFLKNHERHYSMPAEPICAIGLWADAALHGAAILGRNADGDACIGHIYVDGAWQGYSLLYGACVRAFKALGYKRMIL